jgi:hypothetical protein
MPPLLGAAQAANKVLEQWPKPEDIIDVDHDGIMWMP